MRLAPNLPEPRNRDMLAATLKAFGANNLREVCHPQVLAVFRLAIAEAERSPEVAEALNATRSANRGVLVDLIARAQASGVLERGDPASMMEQFFALLWGDLIFGRLLGAITTPKPVEIEQRARAATEIFLKLYAGPMTKHR